MRKRLKRLNAKLERHLAEPLSFPHKVSGLGIHELGS